jgi:hypothetical protein
MMAKEINHDMMGEGGKGGGVIMSIVLIGLDGKILTTWSTSYQKWRLRVVGLG